MNNKQKTYKFMTIPAILLMLCFIGLPLINALRLSFFKWNGYSQSMKFIGIDNYLDIFTDDVFIRTMINTLIYGFGSMILQNIFGLLIAIFVNSKFRGRNGIRVIVYLPIMISAFLMGQIMYYFVQYDGGVLNEILGYMGMDPVYWMSSGWSAVAIITIVNSWQYVGICMLIYLAGLQSIPGMYKEAAQLDGAGKIKEFFTITLPLLIPSITTAVITNLIGGLKMFDVIVSLSAGGPNRESMSLSYYISNLYFTDEKAGYASAVGIMMFFIILLITYPVNRYLRKKEVSY